MTKKIYNKLVRDNIPEIIKKESGLEPKISILDDANFKKYFDIAKHVHPFIGAGVGGSSVRLSGASSSGTAGGLGFQFMAGIKFPFEDVSFVVEYKVIDAEPADLVGSTVDLSGDGFFAGLAINF